MGFLAFHYYFHSITWTKEAVSKHYGMFHPAPPVRVEELLNRNFKYFSKPVKIIKTCIRVFHSSSDSVHHLGWHSLDD